MERVIKATISYEGTNFHGFQKQSGKNLRTVQESLERGLSKFFANNVVIFGAGRTDAGVHAEGQVISFLAPFTIPEEKLAYALNSRMPEDIVIKQAEYVEPDFHARFSAKGKHYRYKIYNAQIPRAIGRNLSYHFPYKLDVARMKNGAEFFLGTHDFAGFAAQGCNVKSTIRRIDRVEIEIIEQDISIDIIGNGFLYNMVRIMVGTLLDVGQGRMSPEKIKEILRSGNRTLAGPTVPPQGLYLIEVFYS